MRRAKTGGASYGYGNNWWGPVSGFFRHYACGNGFRDSSEQCDGDDAAACPGLCGSDCSCASCGNGLVEAGEDCDPGGDFPGDCCGRACRFDAATTACALNGQGCYRCDGAGACLTTTPPQTMCAQAEPGRGTLSMVNLLTRSGDEQISAKWLGVDALDFILLGDPTSSDDYEVCVYDGSSALVAGSLMPAALPDCAGRPCWKAAGMSGYQWRDPWGIHTWISSLRAKAGATGRAQMSFKAKSTKYRTLPMPALPLTPPVRLQFRRANGPCWEAVFSSPELNTSELFKAASD